MYDDDISNLIIYDMSQSTITADTTAYIPTGEGIVKKRPGVAPFHQGVGEPLESSAGMIDPLGVVHLSYEELEREVFPGGGERTVLSNGTVITYARDNNGNGVSYAEHTDGMVTFDTPKWCTTYGERIPTIVLTKSSPDNESRIDIYDDTELIASGHVTYVPIEEKPIISTNKAGALIIIDTVNDCVYEFENSADLVNQVTIYESTNVNKGVLVKHAAQGISVTPLAKVREESRDVPSGPITTSIRRSN